MAKHTAVIAALLAMLALHGTDVSRKEIRFSHKEIVKRQKPEKILKAGRNHPAKGYDPITKTWNHG